mmetsp:Transcript_39369/g.84831  ORF Transcript_39369/g.84831 Transcript_39369/m.84831 type:complete len:91 (+) Transcript_39369:316-588(+)
MLLASVSSSSKRQAAAPPPHVLSVVQSMLLHGHISCGSSQPDLRLFRFCPQVKHERQLIEAVLGKRVPACGHAARERHANVRVGWASPGF